MIYRYCLCSADVDNRRSNATAHVVVCIEQLVKCIQLADADDDKHRKNEIMIAVTTTATAVVEIMIDYSSVQHIMEIRMENAYQIEQTWWRIGIGRAILEAALQES